MPDTNISIPTSPKPEVLDQGLVKHDPSTEAKLAELRKANEAKLRRDLDEYIKPGDTKPTVTDDSKVKAASGRVVEEAAPVPRSMRAIASDGNVLRAESWPWKREPTEAERDAFLRSVRL